MDDQIVCGEFEDFTRAELERIYRADSRRVFATLVRLLGDFELAEEALHDAFAAALRSWPVQGIPKNPQAWLVSAGRFQAIDRLRKVARLGAAVESFHEPIATPHESEEPNVEDDRLRLIFTCCHPALSSEAQIALTLREVCGLATEEIASAFLLPAPTLAQRIVRAKGKIRDARIPYQVPGSSELPERLDAVLQVIYLVFNEGYSASRGDALQRHDLSAEAIRLGRLLIELLPEPEAIGLLALMLLHDARRAARTSESGEMILLEDQDRRFWNRPQIDEGLSLVKKALELRRLGSYTLQSAIAAVHAESSEASHTDWNQICGLYDVLLRVAPTPVVELNRAVAVAMRDGPACGLVLIDAILARGDLQEYSLAHSARADLCRRLNKFPEARTSYEKALVLTSQGANRRFIERRLAELDASRRPG